MCQSAFLCNQIRLCNEAVTVFNYIGYWRGCVDAALLQYLGVIIRANGFRLAENGISNAIEKAWFAKSFHYNILIADFHRSYLVAVVVDYFAFMLENLRKADNPITQVLVGGIYYYMCLVATHYLSNLLIICSVVMSLRQR